MLVGPSSEERHVIVVSDWVTLSNDSQVVNPGDNKQGQTGNRRYKYKGQWRLQLMGR